MPAAVNVIGWILRPVSRLIVGLIAIPTLRAVRKRIPGMKAWDAEFEKDIEQWFRASLLLLVATKNAERWLTAWLNAWWGLDVGTPDLGLADLDVNGALEPRFDLNQWWITAGRLLLAIGVVESMPDQDLFSIIHPGPKWCWDRRQSVGKNAKSQCWPLCRGLVCQHLNRSSPMFAILAVFFGGTPGWIFYGLALVQYLIIGLVTSRDRALDVLSQFDRMVAEKRQELVEEFELGSAAAKSPP